MYQASSLGAAETALAEFKKKWDETYPIGTQTWKNNWNKLSAYFKYSEPIKKQIWLFPKKIDKGMIKMLK
ncbi:transposase [Marinitoga hydrogenitolerans]|uniref:transposase n=1 Tax=Marinitoga hydrogenitolerans TaxID=287990 RepID=UPI001160B40A